MVWPQSSLDYGQVLTEDSVILQYLADLKPLAGLAPAAGTMARYRLMEWLNYIATELHQPLGSLFIPRITPEWKENQIARFGRRAELVDRWLASHHYLMGDDFGIADAYLFTVMGWCKLFHIDLSDWPDLANYLARIAGRASVQAAMTAEGLIGV